MATIKSHTDLSQSKKLAEILPHESADMCWFEGEPFVEAVTGYEEERAESHRQAGMEMYPCWSLAAMISILPQSIEFKGNKYYLRFMKEYVEYANDEISITGRCLHTIGNDNLVDACVEMIIKLHEQNLL